MPSLDVRESIKQPIARVIDAATGLVIANTLTKENIALSYFSYKFSDEDNDECEMTLEAATLKDLLKLRISYNTLLRVSWGYTPKGFCPWLLVTVKDMEVKYGNNVTWLKLNCTDLVSNLNTVSGAVGSEMNILGYLKYKALDKEGFRYRVIIKEDNHIVYKQDRDKVTLREINDEGDLVEEEQQITMVAPPDWTRAHYEPFLQPIQDQLKTTNIDAKSYVNDINPNRFKVDLKKKEIPEVEVIDDGNDFKIIELPKKDPNELIPEEGVLAGLSEIISVELKTFLITPRAFVETNRTPIQNLREIFGYAPRGPWYVTGRGDTIVIHNRDIGANIYKSYFYRQDPVDLVDLTIKSESESYEHDMMTVSQIDPITGLYLNADLWLQGISDMREFNEILEDTKITNQEKIKELEEWHKAYLQYDKYRIRTHLIRTYKEEKVAYERETRLPSPGIDPGYAGQAYYITKRYDAPFITYSTPSYDEDDMRNLVRNKARAIEMDRLKLNSAIFVGDINLVSERIIFIGNLLSIHMGSYYLEEVTHTVTADGYKVTAKGFRVKASSGAMETFMKAEPGKSSELEGDIKELWIKQQNLFAGKHRYDILIEGKTLNEIWHIWHNQGDREFLNKYTSPYSLGKGDPGSLFNYYTATELLDMFYNGKLVFSRSITGERYGDMEVIPSSATIIDETIEYDLNAALKKAEVKLNTKK